MSEKLYSLHAIRKIINVEDIEIKLEKLQCFVKECCSKIPINVGTGFGLFKKLNQGKWEFKTLLEGNNITITESNNELTISSIGGGSFNCSDLNSCSTTNLPEGNNLYYTDARVLSYVSTLPVSTFANNVPYLTAGDIPTDFITSISDTAQINLDVTLGNLTASFVSNNISQFTNNSGYVTQAQTDLLYYPLSNPSNYISLLAISAGTGISYNNLTGVISNTAPNLPDYIQSISDTNTVDLDVTASNLTANVRHQDSTTIDLSDNASGLKADLATGAAIANLGYTPENVANKATDFTTINNTLYPSVQAVENRILSYHTRLYISTGDQTTTSDTAQNITGLSFTALANTRYFVKGMIQVGCNNTGGVKVAVNYPSGNIRIPIQLRTATATNTTLSNQLLQSTALSIAFALSNSDNYYCFFEGEIKIGITGGTVNFQFASTTAGQTSKILQLGTIVEYFSI